MSFLFSRPMVPQIRLLHTVLLQSLRMLGSCSVSLGCLVFVTGVYINIHSDRILRNLRKPGETDYKIPYGTNNLHHCSDGTILWPFCGGNGICDLWTKPFLKMLLCMLVRWSVRVRVGSQFSRWNTTMVRLCHDVPNVDDICSCLFHCEQYRAQSCTPSPVWWFQFLNQVSILE